MSLPRKTILPCDEISRISARPSVVLPEPELADDAERLALAHRDVDAVHRLDVADDRAEQAALDREPDLDVVGRHHHRRAECRPWADRPSARRRGDAACRRASAGWKTSSVGPCSTIRPLVITQTRSAIRRTMPRSWVMNSIAMPVSRLEVAEELQDLRLHRHVERRGRLVGDEEVGLVGERHGDHHPLALAAGKLVRIGAEPALGLADADLLEELEHALARRLIAHAAMHLEHLADLPLDGVQRVERGHRLLEDDADVVAADAPAAPCSLALSRSLPLKRISPVGMRCRRVGQELHDRQRGHRFARSRLADQRHASRPCSMSKLAPSTATVDIAALA